MSCGGGDTSSGPQANTYRFVGGGRPTGEPEYASSGTVTLESIDVGKHAAGYFDLMLKGDHVTGSFDSAPCAW